MTRERPDTPEIARARDDRYRQRSGAHVARYLESNGADGYNDNPHHAPTLLLTTTGRRSGRSVVSPLYFGERDGRYVIIASYEGADAHPRWYLNLQADPHVHVQIRADRFAAIAREVADDDYESWWSVLADRYPFYTGYRARANRTIPVVIIERIHTSSDDGGDET